MMRMKKDLLRDYPGVWAKLVNAALFANVHEPVAAAAVWSVVYAIQSGQLKPKRGSIVRGFPVKYINDTIKSYRKRKPLKYSKTRKIIINALQEALFCEDSGHMEHALMPRYIGC